MDNKLKSKRNFLIWSLVAYSLILLVFTFIFSNYNANTPEISDHNSTDNFFESLGKFSKNLRQSLSEGISTLFDYARFLILFSYCFLIFLYCFVKKINILILLILPVFQLAITYFIQFLIYNLPGMPESPLQLYYVLTISYIIATILLVKWFYSYLLNANYEKADPTQQ